MLRWQVSARTARRCAVPGPSAFRRPESRRYYQASDNTVPQSQDAAIRRTIVQDIADHCELHPELGQNCHSVHHWLVGKIDELEAQRAAGTAPAKDLLQCTLNEIVSAGSVGEVYRSVSLLKQLEERRLSGQSHQHHNGADHAAITTLSNSCIGEQERLLLTRLFESMDTNGDGRLTWNEFMNALHNIDDDLEEEELELVSSALDLHGSLSLDQFLAVVEKAEESRDEAGCDARRLRHMTHRDHRPDQVDRMWGNSCM